MGLRTFWRKHHSWQTSGHDSVHDSSGSYTLPTSRMPLSAQLSKAGYYHLQRLRKLLWLRYGQSFHGDEDPGLHAMIRYAARKRDQDIQRELLLLYLNCSPAMQELLRGGSMPPSSGEHS